jgi:hypothetical protein
MPLPAFARGLRLAALCAVTVLIGLGLSASATPADAADAATSAVLSTGTQVLQSYMTQSGPSDPRYYANGTWYATDGPSCWYCYDSAAVGAATFAQQPAGNAQLRQVAIDTFNSAIGQHQLPDGAFDDDSGSPDGLGTGFFAVDLGVAYLELRDSLDSQTRANWSAAIGAAADYLINTGNTTWYVNGNVNLRQTEVMWLAWVATQQPRFLTAYDAEWSFTVSPSQSRWPGFGLQITKAPSRADGSDGAGYLAESGGGAPGFDPSYTDAQLDTATDLYVLTHDPKYLRLMNLLFNQLRPLIDSTWTLDAQNGTRRSDLQPFLDPAPSVLVDSGDRPDLASGLGSQMARLQQEYAGAQTFTNVNYYKGVESWISMPLLSLQWPRGMAPDTRSSQTDTPSPAGTSEQPPAAPPSIAVTLVTPTSPVAKPGASNPQGSAKTHPAVTAKGSAATPRLSVTKGVGGAAPRITLSNAPLHATVTISLTARTFVSAGRQHKPTRVLVHLRTLRVYITKPRVLLKLNLTARQLRMLSGHRWTLLTNVKIVHGRMVRELDKSLLAVTFARKRAH